MKKLGVFFTLVGIVLLIQSCISGKKVPVVVLEPEQEPVVIERKHYNITGEISNSKAGSMVVLQFIEGGIRPTSIDTAFLDESGKFEMSENLEDGGIGRILLIGSRLSYLTVLEPADYHFVIDPDKLAETKVSGNPLAEEFAVVWKMLNTQAISLTDSKVMIDTLNSPYSAFVVASNVKGEDQGPMMQIVRERLSSETADSLMVKNLDLMIQQKALEAQVQKQTAIGAQAPEITSKDPAGIERKLSDLKGKYVLVDFWASWCGPCRKENPTVIKAWNKHKAKGFEVFGVSLDSNKDRWIQAIEKDALAWKYHVSDLKKWDNKAAQDYGVNSIPANFLLDQEGRIIAKNLRGHVLLQTLDKLFAD